MQTPILQVKHLTTRLQIGQATIKMVDDISFDLYPGKTLALVGESGCGKSLTAHSILRILSSPPALPSEGEVIYNGVNILSLKEKEMRKIRGGRLAMIFQDASAALNPVYTIGDQLLEVAEIHLSLYGNQANDRIIQALEEVGIPSPKERLLNYPHQLSGGMRQRVMIAMALICEPDVLIADEPTTALDVTIQAQVLALIKTLQRKKNMALLLITHDMGIVAEMADDVVVMYAAQAVESGSVVSIFDAMGHPYTQELFAARPSLHPPGAPLHTIKGNVPSPAHMPKGCRFHPRCPYVMPRCLHGRVPAFPVGDLLVSRDLPREDINKGLSSEDDLKSPHKAKCWLLDKSDPHANGRPQP